MAALKQAARQGRGGDTRLGHLTNGDVVIPAERLTEKSRKLVDLFLKASGVQDPKRFTVGHGQNSRNPKTRLPEFSDGGNGTAGGDAPGTDSAGGGSGGSGGTAAGVGGAVGGGASGMGVGGGDASGGGNASPGAGVAGSDGSAPGNGDPGGVPSGAPTQSQTVVDAVTSPPVSNTFGQTGIPGAINDISNSVQGKLTAFQNDPIGTLAALGINVGIGAIPGIGQALGFANTAAGLFGQDLGSSVVGGVRGAFNGSSAPSSSPSGIGGLGGDLGASPGAGLDSLGGNIGTGFDDSILKRRLRES